MWGSPKDRSRVPPHGPPYGPSHPPHAPPYGPPHGPPLGRGYEMSHPHAPPPPHVHYPPPPPPPRDVHGNPADPYQHLPIYRHPPPPLPLHRYDYGYSHPPSYSPQYSSHHQPRPYYSGEVNAPVEEPQHAIPVIGGGCTCKKSKCLKLYCQCFSSSTTCGPKCKCQECHNTTQYRDDIDEARQVILERNPAAFELKVYPTAPPPESPTKSGCKCRRSFCLKKYCECFNHGSKCGPTCRCVNCRNQPDDSSDRPLSGPYSQAQTKSIPRSSLEYDPMPQMEPVADRMAIMAAVAMTELFGRKRSHSDEDTLPDPKRRKQSEEPHGDQAIVSASSSSNSSSPEPNRPSPRASPIAMTSFTNHRYHYSSSPKHGASSLDDSNSSTRLSGLPKSLSFRKICSRCGKTRGEHGELGFGHRCVFQECGKCGAGVQMHGSGPMGVLCTLSEQDGALPGAARAYESKILDLAIRADLQQKLQQGRVGTSSGKTQLATDTTTSNGTAAIVGL